jgi:hypothetical protein
MPKGEKLRAIVTGSVATRVYRGFDQNPLIVKVLSCGGEISLWEKGEFLTFDQN